MRLNVRAMAFGLGILWSIIVLVTGFANLIRPAYGVGFLQVLASVYPGYKVSGSIGDLLIGVVYSLVDGWLCGLVLAWIYNIFVGTKNATHSDAKRREAGVRYSPVEPRS